MNSDELVNKLEATKNRLWKFEKKLGKMLINLLKSVVEYGIMVAIMLWVYHTYGWNYTLIALGCGVILFGLRTKIKEGVK